jgi:hypothetical protein
MACSLRRGRQGKAVEVAGTWDFKWPLGTEIRVAFQRPPMLQSGVEQQQLVRAFDQARAEIIRLATRWREEVGNALERDRAKRRPRAMEFFRKGISLSFPDDLVLDAPDRDTPILGSEHRSPFLQRDVRERPYDVLVSLEDLPIVQINPFKFRGESPKDAVVGPRRGLERITMPQSELGSYARWVDYGVPTIYLGRFGGHKEKPLLDFLQTDLAQHIVVHEFGHVLGLPHSHQSPHLPDIHYKAISDIRDAIAHHNKLEREDVTEQTVKESIVDRWSGGLDFSDWGKAADAPSIYELDSVMAAAHHVHCLLPQDPPKPSTDVPSIRVRPSDSDVAHLIRMYAPCGCEEPERPELLASRSLNGHPTEPVVAMPAPPAPAQP